MLEPVVIVARDIPDAWYQCINEILERGYIYKVTKGSYEGQKRWELDYVTVRISHPSQRPLVPDIPAQMTMPPPTTIEAVEKYLPYLMTNERQVNESYTYGERLLGRKDLIHPPKLVGNCSVPVSQVTQFNDVDQIQTVIDTFKKVGEGWNQGTMEIAMPNDCGTLDPPCLRIIDCRLRYGALHFFLYFRSWDLWGGFPANLAAIQFLKEYMAKQIGCEDGEIIAASKGLHLYDYSWDLAKLRTYKK